MTRLQAAQAVAAQFELTDEEVQNCFEEFVQELNAGLEHQSDTVCQIPTYITQVAHGTEKGFCLSVDLGGSNLRVCSVDLHGDSTYTTRHLKMAIPQDIMQAKEANRLFSFIAGLVKIFLEESHPDQLSSGNTLHLGLCFAFPVHQTSINSGVLLRWTKGFDIEDAVGKDVCQLLQNELDDLEVPVRITAIANDALGTAMTRAYTLPLSRTRTFLGAIFGTGTNGVYLEKLSKVTKDIGEHDASTGEMFLNTEWGSLDSKLKVLPNTEYDVEVDNGSLNKGYQMFEKRVSGMFLGELLRLTVEKLYDDPTISLLPNFRRGSNTLMLRNRWTVDASILSVAEGDESPDLGTLKKKVETMFGIPGWAVTLQDTQAIQGIAKAIGKRAARLAGAAVAAVLYQSGKLEQVDSMTLPAKPDSEENSKKSEEARVVDVGVDGSVVELYPHFEEYMRSAIRVIDKIGVEGEQRIRMGFAKDGSSIGTAIIALLAAQQEANAKK